MGREGAPGVKRKHLKKEAGKYNGAGGLGTPTTAEETSAKGPEEQVLCLTCTQT